MRLSTRGQYATRAMLQLALADHSKPLPIREIARLENISEQYLEQIFRDLRKAVLVESVRGAHGGYLLNKDPQQVTVGDIIQAVEGPVVPVECLTVGNSCTRANTCVTRHVWAKLQKGIIDVLDETSLQDMVEMARGDI